jgi:hypothetical protein
MLMKQCCHGARQMQAIMTGDGARLSPCGTGRRLAKRGARWIDLVRGRKRFLFTLRMSASIPINL